MQAQDQTLAKPRLPLCLAISLLVAATLACGSGAEPARISPAAATLASLPAATLASTPTIETTATPTLAPTPLPTPTAWPTSTPTGGGSPTLLFLGKAGNLYTLKLFESEKTPELFMQIGHIDALRFSPDRSQIAYIAGGQIGVIELDTTQRIIYAPPCGDATDIAWSGDGQKIAFYLGPDISAYADYAASPVCADEGVNLMDVDGGNLRHLFSVGRAAGSNELVPSAPIALAPDGKRIAVAFQHTARMLILAVDEASQPPQEMEIADVTFGYSLEWSPTGNYLAAMSDIDNSNATVVLIDIDKGEVLQTISEPTCRLGGARFSPDGKLLLFSITCKTLASSSTISKSGLLIYDFSNNTVVETIDLNLMKLTATYPVW